MKNVYFKYLKVKKKMNLPSWSIEPLNRKNFSISQIYKNTTNLLEKRLLQISKSKEKNESTLLVN